MLVDNYKFDLRLYVAVFPRTYPGFEPTTNSTDSSTTFPFHIYLFNEGLVRFCSERYTALNSETLGTKTNPFMHLTNNAIQNHATDKKIKVEQLRMKAVVPDTTTNTATTQSPISSSGNDTLNTLIQSLATPALQDRLKSITAQFPHFANTPSLDG